MNLLTPLPASAMLSPLSQKTKVGFRSPDNPSLQRPLFKVVFLCPSKIQAALRRLSSVMVARNGQPLKRLAGSWAGTANLLRVAAQQFAVVGGGLSIYPRETAMATYAPSAPKLRLTPRQSLFNLIQRTDHGQQLVGTDLTFTQVSGLLAEFPSLIVKFSRMEALS
ncbi:ash family protein [Methylomicrobium sp. RS1]|uniref:ash family protein n=1 Tax=Candidatus Methylomicrobium oryzae TaxID=2802053 RepID=UPI001924883C|nr:ash family protein [Methylomicrobium sp. RS1]MBL1263883.1 ash family protein [Methylomicrobium sp. RS1]